jgi:hypothetical protein
MKTIFFTLSILFVNIGIAQTHLISKHNGEEVAANFIRSENDLIYYALPQSGEEHKISKYAVSQLTNKQTNQIQKVSDKIVVDSKADYKVVRVLSQDKMIGLKKVNNFNGVATKTKGDSKLAQQNHTAMRIKMQAASNGYPFVSIDQRPDGKYEAVAYMY